METELGDVSIRITCTPTYVCMHYAYVCVCMNMCMCVYKRACVSYVRPCMCMLAREYVHVSCVCSSTFTTV